MAKRPKPPPAIETAVLTQSARRCCVCFALHGDDTVKAGQIAHLDDNRSNNDLDNLAWLCLDHHAQWHTRGNVTKGFTADEVKNHRQRLYRAVEKGTFPNDDQREPGIIKFPPTFNTKTGDKSTVFNTTGDLNVNVRGGRKAPVVSAPLDAIGSSIEMRSYVEYLVGRYIEWRKNGIKRGIDDRPFFPGIMNNLIKSEFGARANLVRRSRFPELVAFVRKAIDNTIWGKNSPHRNYHSFDEHRERVRGKTTMPEDDASNDTQ